MRVAFLVSLLTSLVFAGPKKKGIEWVPTAEKAVELAQSRGKMIFLTVIVDDDQQNRAVMEGALQDSKLRKMLNEFVCLYANYQDEHGSINVRGKKGKSVRRCSDAPTITCMQHQHLAQHYARGHYGDKPVKTPVHFVLSAEEEVLDIIFNGDWEGGMNMVPPTVIHKRLETLLKKHGKGLNEKQYKQMQYDLTTAKAAKARKNHPGELKALQAVIALRVNCTGVQAAKKRLAEIETLAMKELKKAQALAAEQKWEEALEALAKMRESFPRTMAAQAAEMEDRNLRGYKAVKRLLKSGDLYHAGLDFKDRNRPDLARKRFEKCVRLYPETKYGKLAAEELRSLPPAD